MFLWVYIYIHRVCVYKWAYCWVKKPNNNTNLPTYLPYFSVARYANTTIYFGGLLRVRTVENKENGLCVGLQLRQLFDLHESLTFNIGKGDHVFILQCNLCKYTLEITTYIESILIVRWWHTSGLFCRTLQKEASDIPWVIEVFIFYFVCSSSRPNFVHKHSSS